MFGKENEMNDGGDIKYRPDTDGTADMDLGSKFDQIIQQAEDLHKQNIELLNVLDRREKRIERLMKLFEQLKPHGQNKRWRRRDWDTWVYVLENIGECGTVECEFQASKNLKLYYERLLGGYWLLRDEDFEDNEDRIRITEWLNYLEAEIVRLQSTSKKTTGLTINTLKKSFINYLFDKNVHLEGTWYERESRFDS